MKVADVTARVAEVQRLGEIDNEAAHCMEDELHQDVLRAIADGATALAKEALTTVPLDYTRWYA